MVPNDLRGFVALDPFCALIPSRNFALGIKQKNCIVFYAVDQQAKDLIALLKPNLRGFSGLNVLGNQNYALNVLRRTQEKVVFFLRN